MTISLRYLVVFFCVVGVCSRSIYGNGWKEVESKSNWIVHYHEGSTFGVKKCESTIKLPQEVKKYGLVGGNCFFDCADKITLYSRSSVRLCEQNFI